MKPFTIEKNYIRVGTKLAVLGLILKWIPLLVISIEEWRSQVWYYEFSWVPKPLVSPLFAIAILFCIAGYVLGFIGIERYFIAAHHAKKDAQGPPTTRSLIFGLICLSTDIIYFTIRAMFRSW